MAFGKEEAALIFQIKGDATDAVKAISKTRGETLSMEQGFVKAGTLFVASSAAMVTAITGIGTALFGLAKETAEYGSNIKDLADKTGVSTEALSALKVAADESGSSLEEVANKTVKFSKLVGDAAEGSKQAKESLIRLGVDPQEAMNDLDAALEKVFKRINDAKSGVEQTKLATEAFGKAGADIIPVIKSFNGNMGDLIDKAEKLGVVFDQKAADAADEFGDSLDDLSFQIKGVGITIGNELIPAFTELVRTVTESSATNRETIKDWAADTGSYIKSVTHWVQLLIALYEDLTNWTPERFFPDQSSVAALRKKWAEDASSDEIQDMVNAEKNKLRERNRNFWRNESRTNPALQGSGLPNFDDADRRRKEAEASAKKDSAALLNIWKNYAASIVKTYTEAFSKLKEQFDQSGDAEDFQKKLGLLNNLFAQEAEKTVANLNAIENAQAEADKKTANERLLLKQEQAAREEEFAQRVTDTWDEAEKLITARLKKETTEREKLTEERFRRELEMARSNAELAIAWAESDREKGLISEIDFQKRLAIEKESVLQAEKRLLQQREQTAEVLQRLRILENELTIQTLQDVDAISKAVQDLNREIGGAPGGTAGDTLEGGDSGLPGNDSASGGPFDNWTGSWKGLLTTVLGDAPTLTSALGDIGAMFVRMFEQMAQAIGQVVHQWVLYGETGPAVMRKILASALATIAAESAVKAIESLGWAFFFLATHQYTSAAAAFQAAALFGSIAGATALAGRAIAGDAFKQTAAGGSASSASSGSRGFTGGAYSGSEPMTVNGGRNAPAGAAGAIVVRDRSSGLFSQLFKLEWENNGPMRRMLVEEFG